jgi:hypothetical protein
MSRDYPEGYYVGDHYGNRSPAVGWSIFAGIMLAVMGVMDIIQGIVAMIEEDFYVVGREWVFEFDITAWGWIHIILGAVLVASGIGILSGNVLARMVGINVAALAMIANFAWLPYYPIWSMIIIAMCIAVIWALAVNSGDLRRG